MLMPFLFLLSFCFAPRFLKTKETSWAAPILTPTVRWLQFERKHWTCESFEKCCQSRPFWIQVPPTRTTYLVTFLFHTVLSIQCLLSTTRTSKETRIYHIFVWTVDNMKTISNWCLSITGTSTAVRYYEIAFLCYESCAPTLYYVILQVQIKSVIGWASWHVFIIKEKMILQTRAQ